MGTLVEELEPLEDPRCGNAGRHSLHDILVIALCTILCGGETCTGMALFGQSKRGFLESFLPLRNGIPSHYTFSRVFRLLDPEGVPEVVPGIHAPVCLRLRGGAGRGRQACPERSRRDAAPLL